MYCKEIQPLDEKHLLTFKIFDYNSFIQKNVKIRTCFNGLYVLYLKLLHTQ